MCARVAPARMRTALSPWYCTASRMSSCTTDTPAPIVRVSVPFAPLTVTALPAWLTVTPAGTSITRLATLDMFSFLVCSGDDAQHFAALTDRVRRFVGHDTLRCRHDHRAHAAEHARNLILDAINAQSRPTHALDPIDYRPALVVLELDAKRGLALVALYAVIRHVTLVLQHLDDRLLQLGRGERDARLARGLAVADTGQQIGDRIGHAH